MSPPLRPRGLDRSEPGVMALFAELPEIKVGTNWMLQAVKTVPSFTTSILSKALL